MKKIGLTGGIGSGKSTVANVFKTLGIPVFDADTEAKKIMEQDATVVAAVTAKFGTAAYINGILNKSYLSNIVFNNAYQLQVLNAITHPATINAFTAWAAQQTTAYIIKEAALLFEAGTATDVDQIIGVTATQALRIQRVMQRDGITREAVLARIDKQINNTIKMRLCDFVITNDELQLLLPQILKIDEVLRQNVIKNNTIS